MSLRLYFTTVLFLTGCVVAGCGSGMQTSRITVTQIKALEAFDSLLPVGADSVVRLYRSSDPVAFNKQYQAQLNDAGWFIDSLNGLLDAPSRIDTLAIDHTFDSFGDAACAGRTIYISSSYFLLYNDAAVIRSVISHEFGHKIYLRLPDAQRKGFEELWVQLGNAALLYLFRDGEYSGNAKFGGHPYESPAEFFASAFNLFCNREKEIAARLVYVHSEHLPLIERVRRDILSVARLQ